MRHPSSLPRAIAILLLGLGVVCGSCTADRGGGAAPAVAAPLAPESADIVAYAAVANLDAALQGAAALAQAVLEKPDPSISAAAFKSQLGAMLGDPDLANLDGSKSIVVVVFKAAPQAPVPPALALLPAKQAAPYEGRLTGLGMSCRFADGLLAVAQPPDALENTAKARALYDRIAAAKLSKVARVFLDADALATAYGPMLKATANQLAGVVGALPGFGAGQGPGIGAILKLEVLALLSILEQCDSLQIDIDAGKPGVGIDATVAGKPESELGSFFAQSSALKAPSSAVIKVGGVMGGAYVFAPEGFSKLFSKILKDLSADAEAKSLITPELTSLISDVALWSDGTAVISMAPSEKGFSMSAVAGLKDAQRFVEMLEKYAGLLAPGGAFAGLYKSMGVELTSSFEKGARTHAGVPVHRWTMGTKLASPAPGGFDPSLMAAFLAQAPEIAAVGEAGLISSAPAELDRMIDAVQSKSPGTRLELKAETEHGAGRHGYVDYDMVGLMKMMAASIPESNPAAAALKALAAGPVSAPPMTLAATFGPSRALFQMRLPSGLFSQFAKLGGAGAQAPPAPLPPPKDE